MMALVATWKDGGIITGLGEPEVTLPSPRCESASNVDGGEGDGAAPSTRKPTTLIAG